MHQLPNSNLTLNQNYNQSSNYYNHSTYLFGCPNNDHDTLNKVQHVPEPNIALISLILLVNTCGIALLLKKLRRSNFFGSYVSIFLRTRSLLDCDLFNYEFNRLEEL